VPWKDKPSWVLQHRQIGIAEDDDTVVGLIGQGESTGDLVAVWGSVVEASDRAQGDAPSPQVLEGIGVINADHMHHEVARIDSGHLGEAREPTEGVEVKSGMLVDHAGESTTGLGGVVHPSTRTVPWVGGLGHATV
jgi:hypothetical protein